MAKRALGLSKAKKAKKAKIEEAEAPTNELTVELGEEIDPDDELGQLRALWLTYSHSDKDNELVVNGIIHECDRMLRKADTDKVTLPDEFHAIYALALASLPIYHTQEIDKVKEFFDAGLERASLGLEKYPESERLHFAKAKILIDRIPMQYISQFDANTENDVKVHKLVDEALDSYAKGEDLAKGKKDIFNGETLDILKALDDVLDMVQNVGRDILEGEESDDEDNSAPVQLPKSHPLYELTVSAKYKDIWRKHMVQFLEYVDGELAREVNRRLGQSYLMDAEEPFGRYAEIAYEEEDGDEDVKKELQSTLKELVSKALEYLKKAQDEADPETWVHVAEALIQLGNIHDVDSQKQEAAYKEAEEILVRANKATNGRFEDVLETLK